MTLRRLVTASFLAMSWISSAHALDLSEDALKAADQSEGLQTFTQYCGACHTLMEGGGNLLGPNLGSLFKREAGTKEGYAYSEAFQSADFAWTPEQFAAFLKDDDGVVPGNRKDMPSIPEERLVDLTAYVAVRTGSVDWGSDDDPSASVATTEGSKLTPLEQQLYDTRQDFWHHLFENTAHYIIQTPDGDDGFTFVAYFNEDGTMSGNIDGLRGFWRVNDLKWFCYALEGIPVEPYEWNECFPIVPNSVERYGQGLWVSEPVPGIKVKGGFLQSRPHPDADDAVPVAKKTDE